MFQQPEVGNILTLLKRQHKFRQQCLQKCTATHLKNGNGEKVLITSQMAAKERSRQEWNGQVIKPCIRIGLNTLDVYNKDENIQPSEDPERAISHDHISTGNRR
jgi:hypothetical protein